MQTDKAGFLNNYNTVENITILRFLPILAQSIICTFIRLQDTHVHKKLGTIRQLEKRACLNKLSKREENFWYSSFP